MFSILTIKKKNYQYSTYYFLPTVNIFQSINNKQKLVSYKK